jgi:hypothetical protein
MLMSVAGLATSVSSAGAAVTLGQIGVPTNQCGGMAYQVQAATAADPRYVVPPGPYGVITSWRFQGSDPDAGSGRLIVWRPTTVANQFIYLDRSAVETFTPGVPVTFATRIPVEPGDVLGNVGEGPCLLATGMSEDVTLFFLSATEPALGSVRMFNGSGPSFRILLAAQVESDCDKDGFGDETQDGNLSSCAPATTLPPAPGAATATCKGIAATIVGTEGNDVRVGSLGQDVIAGLGGNDTLSGIAGNDVICGGAGRDLLKGGKGKDSLLGQKGKDTLKGGGGRDLCKGGKGKDTASKCEVEKSI